MAQYKCFKCEKAISSKQLDKRFVCPHCGSKIFYKPRTQIVKLEAI
ncbi:DNA-directed RNA polymerase subunit P [Candidatus Pacearchaeota archaeon]|nr:DNA-directed RNA polymerase subunit P [Candidatus Pacearchaeota archaeon]